MRRQKAFESEQACKPGGVRLLCCCVSYSLTLRRARRCPLTAVAPTKKLNSAGEIADHRAGGSTAATRRGREVAQMTTDSNLTPPPGREPSFGTGKFLFALFLAVLFLLLGH